MRIPTHTTVLPPTCSYIFYPRRMEDAFTFESGNSERASAAPFPRLLSLDIPSPARLALELQL